MKRLELYQCRSGLLWVVIQPENFETYLDDIGWHQDKRRLVPSILRDLMHLQPKASIPKIPHQEGSQLIAHQEGTDLWHIVPHSNRALTREVQVLRDTLCDDYLAYED